ncbi:MAG: hypothetical protein ACRDI0_08565 [Actinomycetota bacterium]
MARGKGIWLLVAMGLVVGLVVAFASSLTGRSLCGVGEAGRECLELTRTLAIRTGAVAGVATVVMGLVAAGLLRMLSQGERQRAERAREAYLASRGQELPSEE